VPRPLQLSFGSPGKHPTNIRQLAPLEMLGYLVVVDARSPPVVSRPARHCPLLGNLKSVNPCPSPIDLHLQRSCNHDNVASSPPSNWQVAERRGSICRASKTSHSPSLSMCRNEPSQPRQSPRESLRPLLTLPTSGSRCENVNSRNNRKEMAGYEIRHYKEGGYGNHGRCSSKTMVADVQNSVDLVARRKTAGPWYRLLAASAAHSRQGTMAVRNTKPVLFRYPGASGIPKCRSDDASSAAEQRASCRMQPVRVQSLRVRPSQGVGEGGSINR